MFKNKISLAETHPHISIEWHPTKNEELTPYQFPRGSKKKVWWICSVNRSHEWETRISDRTSGSGCPYCTGRKVNEVNCLAVKNPRLAAEWHPTRNKDSTPNHVGTSSNKKFWWLCSKNPAHVWEARVASRHFQRSDCPYCSGHRVSDENSLARTHPELINEWHPSKNGNLTPYDFIKGSGKKVWWQCPKGHEWQTSIRIRANGSGCHYCSFRRISDKNNLAKIHPELISQWHPTKNGSLLPHEFAKGSNEKVWWVCPINAAHEWKTSILSRTYQRTGCPSCSFRRVTDEMILLGFCRHKEAEQRE